MNIKFYLSSGKKERTLRACFIKNRLNQFKVQIPFKISPNYWDNKGQTAKNNMHGADAFNESLQLYKLDLMKQIRLMNLDGITDWDIIKSNIKCYIKTGQNSVVKKSNIIDSIDEFLKSKSVDYKPETIRKYKILQTLIESYEHKYKFTLSTEMLDFSIVDQFRRYVLYDRNNRNDTAYRMLASLKCVIRWLIKNGYEINASSLQVNQPVKNKYDIVTLSEVEINQITKVKLSPEQTKIRDCFLFQIYTGQRFSDMQQLCPEQVKDNMWIFRSVKTGKLMHIHFVGWVENAKTIAEKYNYNFPQYTSQYFNRALKLICRNAKIETQVKLTRYQGVKEIIIDKPKHKLVSSHTARRTCVSILLAKGLPPTIVMKLTGHSDIKTMMKYERTTTEALENSLKKIKFL